MANDVDVTCRWCGFVCWHDPAAFCPQCRRDAEGEYDICTPEHPCPAWDCSTCNPTWDDLS